MESGIRDSAPTQKKVGSYVHRRGNKRFSERAARLIWWKFHSIFHTIRQGLESWTWPWFENETSQIFWMAGIEGMIEFWDDWRVASHHCSRGSSEWSEYSHIRMTFSLNEYSLIRMNGPGYSFNWSNRMYPENWNLTDDIGDLFQS